MLLEGGHIAWWVLAWMTVMTVVVIFSTVGLMLQLQALRREIEDLKRKMS
jgi:hypothetical protein